MVMDAKDGTLAQMAVPHLYRVSCTDLFVCGRTRGCEHNCSALLASTTPETRSVLAVHSCLSRPKEEVQQGGSHSLAHSDGVNNGARFGIPAHQPPRGVARASVRSFTTECGAGGKANCNLLPSGSNVGRQQALSDLWQRGVLVTQEANKASLGGGEQQNARKHVRTPLSQVTTNQFELTCVVFSTIRLRTPDVTLCNKATRASIVEQARQGCALAPCSCNTSSPERFSAHSIRLGKVVFGARAHKGWTRGFQRNELNNAPHLCSYKMTRSVLLAHHGCVHGPWGPQHAPTCPPLREPTHASTVHTHTRIQRSVPCNCTHVGVVDVQRSTCPAESWPGFEHTLRHKKTRVSWRPHSTAGTSRCEQHSTKKHRIHRGVGLLSYRVAHGVSGNQVGVVTLGVCTLICPRGNTAGGGGV